MVELPEATGTDVVLSVTELPVLLEGRVGTGRTDVVLSATALPVLPDGRVDKAALAVELVPRVWFAAIVLGATVASDEEDCKEDGCAPKKELAEDGEEVAEESKDRALVEETTPAAPGHFPNCAWHPGPVCSAVSPQ